MPTDSLSYFNINGCFGRGAHELPEFPDAAAMVAHLDYLEVDRSLAWQVVARDFNPNHRRRPNRVPTALLSKIEGLG